MSRQTAVNFALALATGVMLVLLYPRFGYTFLAPFALAPLLVALAREQRWIPRFLLGYLAGVVFWAGVCYWIEGTLDQYANMGTALAMLAFALFAILKALHFGLFGLLAAVLIRKPLAALTVAALWTAIERTNGPFGFAWLTLGDAGTSMSMPMRLAPITGVYGLSFLFALMATVIALAALRRPRREWLWIALVAVLPLLPALPASVRGSERALLVQPNVPEDTDWSLASVHSTVESLADMSLKAAQASGAQLIVWPEAPLPLYFYRDTGSAMMVATLARAAHVPVLFGTVGEAPGGGPTNSAILLDQFGNVAGRYDKNFLVPFGEYVPPFFRWVNRVTQEAGDFVPGRGYPVFGEQGHKLGVFICYESAFPYLVRRFPAAGAQALVNVSNDGYFGTSAARQQHLKLVRMRAAENARWILRATNDGLTTVVDPAGRVHGIAKSFERSAWLVGFNWQNGTTFFTHHPEWFPIACALIAALGFVPWRRIDVSKQARAHQS